MRTKEYIDNKIKDMQIHSPRANKLITGTKREVNHLPEILRPDEELEYITSGNHSGSTWLIVVTSKRIMLLNKGLIKNITQKDFMLDKIISVNGKSGLMFGKILIDIGSKADILIDLIDKQDLKILTSILNEQILEFKNNLYKSQENDSQTINNSNLIEKIKELHNLKEAGIISESEFLQAKQKLIN